MRYEVLPEGEQFVSMKALLVSRNPSVKIENLSEYDNNDFSAPCASGSSGTGAVVICPCSMKTLSSVACGYSDNLISRAADTALKEARPCVLVPRETPLNLIHLENMAAAKRAGAHIVVPAMGFYTRPRTVDDMVNFIVGKILSLLGVDHDLYQKWGGGDALP
jgi:4-hydroxy-3-polyprenylbenzoate decarboxylase